MAEKKRELDELEKELLAQVKKVPLLAGLKEDQFEDIIRGGKLGIGSKLRRFPANQVICREGEFHETLYIVLSGAVAIFKRMPDGKDKYIVSLSQHSFFGETSVMMNQPRAATVKAETDAYVLEMPRDVFNTVCKALKPFKEAIDRAYLERSLLTHLKYLTGAFKSVPDPVMKLFASRASLVKFDEGQRIFTDNTEADAFYLIRTGYVKMSDQDVRQGAEVIQAYRRENTYIGEEALLGRKNYTLSATALNEVDAVKILRKDFEELAAQHAVLRENILALEGAQHGELKADEKDEEKYDQTIANARLQTRDSLVIDLDLCVRCDNCVKSCADLHGGVSRLQRKGYRRNNVMFTISCSNCKNPECMLACGFGVISRDRSGSVKFDSAKCTGCTKCSQVCPFGTITMAPVEEEAAGGFFKRLFRRYKEEKLTEAAPQKKPKRKSVKCDLCVGYSFTGCIWNCPTGAIQRLPSEVIMKMIE